MSRIRFRIVFMLVILILLLASAVFGVLTYWLDGDPPPISGLRWTDATPLYRAPQPAKDKSVDDLDNRRQTL